MKYLEGEKVRKFYRTPELKILTDTGAEEVPEGMTNIKKNAVVNCLCAVPCGSRVRFCIG
jgi:hypothetical protein